MKHVVEQVGLVVAAVVACAATWHVGAAVARMLELV